MLPRAKALQRPPRLGCRHLHGVHRGGRRRRGIQRIDTVRLRGIRLRRGVGSEGHAELVFGEA